MHKTLLLAISLIVFSGLRAATFTSLSNGNYNQAVRWSVVGSDADGIPDADDNVTLNHIVSLFSNGSCKNLITTPGKGLVLNNFTIQIYGSLTNNGGVAGSPGSSVQFMSTGSMTGNLISTNALYFYQNFTIGVGCGTSWCSSVNVSAGKTLTNNGSVLNNGQLVLLAGATWINAAGSTLTTNGISSTGLVNAAAATNTVTYSGNYTTVKGTGATYYNLVLTTSPAATKTLSGALDIDNNFTISTGVTLNCASNNIAIGGSWTNNANTNCQNMGTTDFNGTGTQTITRATGNTERFNNIDLNGTSTVTLGDSLNVLGNININSGALDVSASNYTIHCKGSTFQDNSSFVARQGTVFMDGSISQSIDGFIGTSFYNLTINNSAGVTVNFTKKITNILNVISGSFGPSMFGSIMLIASGPTTCARIAPLGATGSLNGTSWLIQTYINGPATAYWQYLGSPVTSSTLQDWDGDTRFYMSGVGGNDGNACCPVFRSVRTYNTASNTYTNITSVSTALTPGLGYMVWMADNLNSLTGPLVFDTRGTPNTGTINRAVTAGGSGAGYNLVSNPLPCPVNYASVVAASSATLNSNFLILQDNGSYATNPNGGTIAGAQGFMCIASASGNITFTESCKSLTATPNVIRQLPGNSIRIKVGNQVNGLGEEAVVKLNPGADESMDLTMDLPYLPSPYDNATHIYTQNSLGEQFLLNELGTESDHLAIPVAVVTSTPGVQTLTFKDLNTVTEYNCAWLEDLTTGERINLNATDTYEFTEDEMGVTRNFMLHFERTNDCAFDLQTSTASLDAQSNVFVSGNQIFAQFEFETEEVVTISMYDLGGRMVMGETTMNVATQTVALNNPDAHGIYLVRIQKGNEVSTKKIYY